MEWLGSYVIQGWKQKVVDVFMKLKSFMVKQITMDITHGQQWKLFLYSS